MINYSEILKKNLYGVMATLDGTRPKTRVFQYLFSDGDKVYFGTTDYKPVYKQMHANPYVSFCTYSDDFAPVLSVNGKAVFVENIELKTRAMDEYPAIKELYKTPNNPVFKIFYIDVDGVDTFDFTEGAKKFQIK